jgi:DNA replication protein DnaC
VNFDVFMKLSISRPRDHKWETPAQNGQICARHVTIIITSNLPFEAWTSVLGSERLASALLDRLPHHVSILTINGDRNCLRQSAERRRAATAVEQRSK